MDASTRGDGSGVELVTRRASYWTQHICLLMNYLLFFIHFLFESCKWCHVFSVGWLFFFFFFIGKNFNLAANFLRRHFNLRCLDKQLYGGAWPYFHRTNFRLNESEIISVARTQLSHRPSKSSVVCMLIFPPFTSFYVLSLPARGVVLNMWPLSASLERLLRVGEKGRETEGSENLSPWPI